MRLFCCSACVGLRVKIVVYTQNMLIFVSDSLDASPSPGKFTAYPMETTTLNVSSMPQNSAQKTCNGTVLFSTLPQFADEKTARELPVVDGLKTVNSNRQEGRQGAIQGEHRWPTYQWGNTRDLGIQQFHMFLLLCKTSLCVPNPLTGQTTCVFPPTPPLMFPPPYGGIAAPVIPPKSTSGAKRGSRKSKPQRKVGAVRKPKEYSAQRTAQSRAQSDSSRIGQRGEVGGGIDRSSLSATAPHNRSTALSQPCSSRTGKVGQMRGRGNRYPTQAVEGFADQIRGRSSRYSTQATEGVAADTPSFVGSSKEKAVLIPEALLSSEVEVDTTPRGNQLHLGSTADVGTFLVIPKQDRDTVDEGTSSLLSEKREAHLKLTRVSRDSLDESGGIQPQESLMKADLESMPAALEEGFEQDVEKPNSGSTHGISKQLVGEWMIQSFAQNQTRTQNMTKSDTRTSSEGTANIHGKGTPSRFLVKELSESAASADLE